MLKTSITVIHFSTWSSPTTSFACILSYARRVLASAHGTQSVISDINIPKTIVLGAYHQLIISDKLEGLSDAPFHFIFRYKGDSVDRYRR